MRKVNSLQQTFESGACGRWSANSWVSICGRNKYSLKYCFMKRKNNSSFPTEERNYKIQKIIHNKRTINVLPTNNGIQNRLINLIQSKCDKTDTAKFVCSQMVQESLSLFMFLLQVKEKEETFGRFEWSTNTLNMAFSRSMNIPLCICL
jgi:hypothetical protein